MCIDHYESRLLQWFSPSPRRTGGFLDDLLGGTILEDVAPGCLK